MQRKHKHVRLEIHRQSEKHRHARACVCMHVDCRNKLLANAEVDEILALISHELATEMKIVVDGTTVCQHGLSARDSNGRSRPVHTIMWRNGGVGTHTHTHTTQPQLSPHTHTHTHTHTHNTNQIKSTPPTCTLIVTRCLRRGAMSASLSITSLSTSRDSASLSGSGVTRTCSASCMCVEMGVGAAKEVNV